MKEHLKERIRIKNEVEKEVCELLEKKGLQGEIGWLWYSKLKHKKKFVVFSEELEHGKVYVKAEDLDEAKAEALELNT